MKHLDQGPLVRFVKHCHANRRLLGPAGGLAMALFLIAGGLLLPESAPNVAERALIAASPPLTPQEQLKTFRLPPGFKIELVASEPDVPKPINLSFDARGRLYVTCSTIYPIQAKSPAEARDKIVVLSDRDGDGAFEQARALVEGLNIPIGVMAIDRELLYYSIPNIYRFEEGRRGSQDARSRVLYGIFGCQDTHGMVNAFTPWVDGWVYACHGFANVSEVKLKGGRAVAFRGGATFRMRADGSNLESFTYGQVNPFGLAFDPLGNLFSADSTTWPAYQLLHGASYPSADAPAADGLGYAPAMMSHKHGSTGIAGIVYYAADGFPPEYRDTLFIGNPITGTINHDRLERHGSTMLAIEQPDFLTSSDPWFRPVDLKLGPDGALYVADFYNAVIAHVELPLTHPARDHQRGRIWRISSTAARPAPRPVNLKAASPEELVSLLRRENLTLRVLATEELAGRGWRPLVADFTNDDSPGSHWRRAHLLWLYERGAQGGLTPDLVRRLADDSDACVRVHLMKALAERTGWTHVSDDQPGFDIASLVRTKLSDVDPFVRRAAAEALGRHPDAKNVRPLLELWRTVAADDTHLEHVAAMAVRDQLLFLPEVFARLEQTLGRDPNYDGLLIRAGLGLPGATSAERQIDYLRQGRLAPAERPRFVEAMLPSLSQLRLAELCDVLETTSGGGEWLAQAQLLKLLSSAARTRGIRLSDSTEQWSQRVAKRLFERQAPLELDAAIQLSEDFEIASSYSVLMRLASGDSHSLFLRSRALVAAMQIDGVRALPGTLDVLDDSERPLILRQAAVRALANADRETARQELARRLNVEPYSLAAAVAAELAADRRGAERLISAVARSQASPRLLETPPVRERLELAGIDRSVAISPNATPPRALQEQEFSQQIERRRDAFLAAETDQTAGRETFQKWCTACHSLDGRGGAVGPALDAIGNRGIDRLLEDILVPSRHIAPEFQASLAVLADGRTVFGRVIRQNNGGMLLMDSQGKESWLPARDIDQVRSSMTSVMPENIGDSMPEEDFNNLVSFLMSKRGQ